MAILFTHIQTLANTRENYHLLRGKDLEELPCLDNAYLIVEGEEILEYGLMDQLRFHPRDFQFHYDVPGQCILPSWCDSHTHLVFPSSREEEFVDKIRGLTYAEIAAKGGGILQTARKLQDTTEEELYRHSRARLVELMKLGTGAVEIKSGYGLSLEGELKMLRVIRRLKNSLKIPVKASFLGAHAIPEVFRDNREAYLQLITQEMLPAIAREGLADYVDVFCEEGFFTPLETERICEAGKHFGLRPKIHANQLHASGGVQAGVRLGALSVDHLETMDDPAIQALAASSTIGTLLPTAAFFLRMPYQPARKLIENNCAIALASDFNPGSSPSGNMNFVLALSCIQMRMLPAEAINAATLNGAYAMEMEDQMGSITVGKKASFILTKPIPSLSYLPYAFGSNLIDRVMLAGDWVE